MEEDYLDPPPRFFVNKKTKTVNPHYLMWLFKSGSQIFSLKEDGITCNATTDFILVMLPKQEEKDTVSLLGHRFGELVS